LGQQNLATEKYDFTKQNSEAMNESQGIKQWAEEDRPREKLMTQGARSLTDSELLAILIRSGSQNETAVEVSRKLLALANNNLNELGKWSVEKIQQSGLKGLGPVKAITIVAALELGKRRKEMELGAKELPRITSSHIAYDILYARLNNLYHEEFWILFLNRNNQVMKEERMSAGGVHGTVVDPKMIFKRALEHNASGIVLAHNHPSGNLKPSDEDIKLTTKMTAAGSMLEIRVIDHIIIAGSSYYSFADEGLL
jgi:DNA repair protein RadC